MLIARAGMALDDPLEVIRRHPFIRYDRNQWGGQIVDRFLRQQGLKVREWLELDALDAIAALVSRGLGIAIVPDWAPPVMLTRSFMGWSSVLGQASRDGCYPSVSEG